MKSSLPSSCFSICGKKYFCKVNQSLFERWDQQRGPQIVVVQKSVSQLDSTWREQVLNTTWAIKQELNWLYSGYSRDEFSQKCWNREMFFRLKFPSIFTIIIYLEKCQETCTEILVRCKIIPACSSCLHMITWPLTFGRNYRQVSTSLWKWINTNQDCIGVIFSILEECIWTGADNSPITITINIWSAIKYDDFVGAKILKIHFSELWEIIAQNPDFYSQDPAIFEFSSAGVNQISHSKILENR